MKFSVVQLRIKDVIEASVVSLGLMLLLLGFAIGAGCSSGGGGGGGGGGSSGGLANYQPAQSSYSGGTPSAGASGGGQVSSSGSGGGSGPTLAIANAGGSSGNAGSPGTSGSAAGSGTPSGSSSGTSGGSSGSGSPSSPSGPTPAPPATPPPAPAIGSTYYVSAGGGSDSNDGLASASSGSHGPWATIGHAASTAQAGDVVHVLAGNYNESVTISNTGNASAPVRFYGASGNATTVNALQMYSASWVEVWNFNVVGSKALPPNWVDMPGVVVDNPSIGWIDPSIGWTSGRQNLVNQKYATYIATVNAWFGSSWSAFTSGIRASSCSNVTIGNNTISLHTIGIYIETSSGLKIQGNSIFHTNNGIFSYAGSGSSLVSSTINGNHCYQNLYSGITIQNSAQNVTIDGNLCEYNGVMQYELQSSSTNCVLSHNVARFAGYYSETMQAPGSSAFSFWSVGPGNVADGNFASYQLDATLNDGNGFIADTSQNGVTFVNNVAYRNEGGGFTLTMTNGNTVVNNTSVGNGYQTASTGTNGAGIRTWLSTGNTIVNNILSGNHACSIYTDGTLSGQSVVDWNLYAPGVPAINDANATYTTAAQAAAATGREAHGISADPQFVNLSGADFHLATSSPAIGAGNASLGSAHDFSSNTRHNPPDMGAFEH